MEQASFHLAMDEFDTSISDEILSQIPLPNPEDIPANSVEFTRAQAASP